MSACQMEDAGAIPDAACLEGRHRREEALWVGLVPPRGTRLYGLLRGWGVGGGDLVTDRIPALTPDATELPRLTLTVKWLATYN